MADDAIALTREQYEVYRQRFNNWGRWGEGDQLGTLNHITADTRRRAAGLVRSGRTVSLARPLATERVLPGHRNQRPADHRIETGGFGCSDYVGVSYHGFANTHIDGLCHIFTTDGRMYGGRPKSDVTPDGALNNSVDHWRGGIVTRGVLYDVVRHRGVPHVTAGRPVHAAELEEIAKAEGVTPEPGDAVVVRMGAAAFWAANPAFEPVWGAPGLHATAMEFLYAHDAALLCWDLMEAPGQDALQAPSLPIHFVAIPYMGMPLLDNADLEDIAAACAEEGRWEFMLTIAPLVVIGGTGSPVNPIAVL